jgi:hypothetical protein
MGAVGWVFTRQSETDSLVSLFALLDAKCLWKMYLTHLVRPAKLRTKQWDRRMRKWSTLPELAFSYDNLSQLSLNEPWLTGVY